MYFVSSRITGMTVANPKLGAACRALMINLGIETPAGDPVAFARGQLQGDLIIYSQSQAFRAIADAGPNGARQLAEMFYQALEDYYQ